MNTYQLWSLWNELPIAPEDVLGEYPLSVAMSRGNIGGLQEGWLFGEKNGEIRLCDPQMRPFYLSGDAIPVTVQSVPMVSGDEVLTEGHIVTLPDRDVSVAVTPLLSGCTIGIRRDGTAMFHKQPQENEDGWILQDRITTTHGGEYRCFGRNNYQRQDCTVIGINLGGWEFYSQRHKVVEIGRGQWVKRVAGVSRIGL